MNLDRDYPQGNPQALYCRHCRRTPGSRTPREPRPGDDGSALGIAQQKDVA